MADVKPMTAKELAEVRGMLGELPGKGIYRDHMVRLLATIDDLQAQLDDSENYAVLDSWMQKCAGVQERLTAALARAEKAEAALMRAADYCARPNGTCMDKEAIWG